MNPTQLRTLEAKAKADFSKFIRLMARRYPVVLSVQYVGNTLVIRRGKRQP